MSSSKTSDTPSGQAIEERIDMKIEKIVQPFYAIFTRTMDKREKLFVTDFDFETVTYDDEDVIMYTVYGQKKDEPFTSKLPEKVLKALSKNLECRTAMSAFLEPMRKDLASIEAQVDWYQLTPNRTISIEYHNAGLPTPITHSVFLITHEKGRFIADFTREQFGYIDGAWLLTSDAFWDKYTIQAKPLPKPRIVTPEQIKVLEEGYGPAKNRIIRRLKQTCELYKSEFETKGIAELEETRVKDLVNKVIEKHKNDLESDRLPRGDEQKEEEAALTAAAKADMVK